MKPGTYEEIIAQIAASKQAELVRAAKLPFTEKLSLTATACASANYLVLSETLADPVIEIVKLFNQAVEAGVFGRYALAGGMAIEYYGAPINTVDADFLVLFPQTTSGLLDPSRFYAFFQSKGAVMSGEYLVFGGMKFQMIPANSELNTEALRTAAPVSEKGAAFFVVTLEHLIALKLATWRYKDRLHINHLLDSGVAVDQAKLSSIIERFQLEKRWNQLLSERATPGS